MPSFYLPNPIKKKTPLKVSKYKPHCLKQHNKWRPFENARQTPPGFPGIGNTQWWQYFRQITNACPALIALQSFICRGFLCAFNKAFGFCHILCIFQPIWDLQSLLSQSQQVTGGRAGSESLRASAAWWQAVSAAGEHLWGRERTAPLLTSPERDEVGVVSGKHKL